VPHPPQPFFALPIALLSNLDRGAPHSAAPAPRPRRHRTEYGSRNKYNPLNNNKNSGSYESVSLGATSITSQSTDPYSARNANRCPTTGLKSFFINQSSI
jgi:hypothetical protein